MPSKPRSKRPPPPARPLRAAPSEDALAQATARMLRTIDDERAACAVQRLANGHGPDDVFTIRPGPLELTYSERMAELERIERNLRGGVDGGILERALEIAGLQ